MKTKQTLSSVTVFISSLKFKLFILLFILHPSLSFSQSSCSADLKVQKNRNSRSSSSSGTFFKMTITNKGSSADIYSLSAINNGSSCTNTDGSSTSSNVNLTILFKDIHLNEIAKISIEPHDTIEFYVNVNVPIGTLINKWCCTQITAKSDTCSSYNVTTDIHTLVINVNE